MEMHIEAKPQTNEHGLVHGLTIVIPAYNEEESIDSIVQRCMAVRATILNNAKFDCVDIIVVNDGSHDRTYERAARYLPQIKLLNHEKNKGYGAAIKYGFRESRTTLVGFLDADGTCDPLFFCKLCEVQREGGFDVVSGNRMGTESEMPRIRRIGNTIFSYMLGALSNHRIHDTASGMRVIKAESLNRLYPLPDGLHFTPAMSSRALFHPNLKLAEVPMPYAERIGESKLHVIKDGLRFTSIIFEMALIYRPIQFFGFISGLLFLLSFAYLPGLVRDVLLSSPLPENRIYRVLSIITFFVGGVTLLGIGLIGQKTSAYLLDYKSSHIKLYNRMLKFIFPIGLLFLLIGVMINIEPLREYLSSGKINQSWTSIAAGALLVLSGIQMMAVSAFDYILNLFVHHRANR